VFRLQQILFFRDLDMPQAEVRQLLAGPDSDEVAALEHHRRVLHGRIEGLGRLLKTIDRTIDRLLEGDVTLTEEKLYEGFSTEQIERYKRKARSLDEPAATVNVQDFTGDKVIGHQQQSCLGYLLGPSHALHRQSGSCPLLGCFASFLTCEWCVNWAGGNSIDSNGRQFQG
jgi:DNA-binding transcriptional MerR regulator